MKEERRTNQEAVAHFLNRRSEFDIRYSFLFFIKFRSSDFMAVWIYDEEKDEYEMVVEGGGLVGMRGWN